MQLKRAQAPGSHCDATDTCIGFSKHGHDGMGERSLTSYLCAMHVWEENLRSIAKGVQVVCGMRALCSEVNYRLTIR